MIIQGVKKIQIKNLTVSRINQKQTLFKDNLKFENYLFFQILNLQPDNTVEENVTTLCVYELVRYVVYIMIRDINAPKLSDQEMTERHMEVGAANGNA